MNHTSLMRTKVKVETIWSLFKSLLSHFSHPICFLAYVWTNSDVGRYHYYCCYCGCLTWVVFISISVSENHCQRESVAFIYCINFHFICVVWHEHWSRTLCTRHIWDIETMDTISWNQKQNMNKTTPTANKYCKY